MSDGKGTLAGSSRPQVVLPLVGDLDVYAANEAHKRLIGLELHRGDELVLDISGVTFMDSSGIRLILQAQDAAVRHGAGFAVRRGSESVMRVLELVGLDEQLNFV